MKSGVIAFFKRAVVGEEQLHPVDRGMARLWIKKRLVMVFPDLRDNPRALEAAYQQLSLDPRAGTEEGDAETVFEMTLPEQT